MGRKAPVEHVPYFEVLETLLSTCGCALCDLEVKAQQRYFESPLYENVNDPGVRNDVRSSHGYCPRHAHALLGFQDALGNTILYRDQVVLFLGFLAGHPNSARRRWWSHGTAGRQWVPGMRCPACRLQQGVRRTVISTVLTWLHDRDLASAFARASGPCAPHFVALLEACQDEQQRQSLVETHSAKLNGLACELDEFRRKSGETGRGESFGPERDARKGVVSLMAGSGEVF